MKVFQKVGQKLAAFLGESDSVDDWALQERSGAEKMLEHNYLVDLLPYRNFNEGTGLFENANSYGFAFEIFPSISNPKVAEDELRTLTRDLFLPSASIQVLLFADPFVGDLLGSWKKRVGKKGGVFQALAEKRATFFEEEVLSENSPLGCSPRNFRRFFSFSTPKDALLKGALERKLQTFKKKAQSAFSRLGQTRELRESDLISLCNNLVGMDKTIHPHKHQPFQSISPINEQIGSGGVIDVKRNGLLFRKEKDMAFKSFQVTEQPTDWGMSFAPSLVGDFFETSYSLPSPFFIQYGLSFLDQQKEEFSLQTKNKLLRQQFRISGVFRKNPHLIEESEEHDRALRGTIQGEKFITTRMTVGLFALPENFDSYEDRLISLFRKNDFKLEESHFFHLDDFIRSLPMTWGESPFAKDLSKTRVCKTTLTTEAPLFFPLLAEGNGNASDGMLFLGRKGQISFFDNFATSSGTNMTLLGSTGKGKSVLLAEILKDRLGREGRAFVFDKGRSFENLCGHFGGKHLCFDDKSNLDLNPFSLIESGKGEKADLSRITEILATMAQFRDEVDEDMKAVLGQAAMAIFRKKGNKATVDDLIDILGNTPQKTPGLLEEAAKVALRLRKFSSRGEYSCYFFGENKLSLKEDLVVFETQELSSLPDLRAVIIQIFAFLVSKEVLSGNRERKALIVIDEAHAQLDSPQMESFCSAWAKEVRKYGAALICCTQNYIDLQKTPGAKGIYANSNFLCMLADDPALLKDLRETEGGENIERFGRLATALRKTDDYSEILIREQDQKSFALYRLRLDPFSILLFSSNAQEYAAMERLKKEGFSIEEVIDWLAPQRKRFREIVKTGDVSIEEALLFLKKENPIQKKEQTNVS
jgi:conjugal transfer ATP-binding protein TraC